MIPRDDVLRMAREAGFEEWHESSLGENCLLQVGEYPVDDQVFKFAALIEAEVTEACAKVCEEIIDAITHQNAEECWPWDAVADCAAAIRARGK